MVRPFRHETERYGEYSKPGEFVYDHPFLWGSRRIGPDLAREGGKYRPLARAALRESARDHAAVDHAVVPPLSSTRDLDFDGIQTRVDAMAMLGVPYGDAVNRAPTMAREQASPGRRVDRQRKADRTDSRDKEIVAIIAYLQRLGQGHRGGRRQHSGHARSAAPGREHGHEALRHRERGRPVVVRRGGARALLLAFVLGLVARLRPSAQGQVRARGAHAAR